MPTLGARFACRSGKTHDAPALHHAPCSGLPAADKLLRWDALPVQLSGTSNGWVLNWVLKGQASLSCLPLSRHW